MPAPDTGKGDRASAPDLEGERAQPPLFSHLNPGAQGPSCDPDKTPSTTPFSECVMGSLVSLSVSWGQGGRTCQLQWPPADSPW